jgi:hypothetical protein
MPGNIWGGLGGWSVTVRLKASFQVTRSHHATYLPRGFDSHGSLFENFLRYHIEWLQLDWVFISAVIFSWFESI